jgi:hypothetical protein
MLVPADEMTRVISEDTGTVARNPAPSPPLAFSQLSFLLRLPSGNPPRMGGHHDLPKLLLRAW